MVDVAALGISADSSQVVKTTGDLRDMAQTARDLQNAVNAFTEAMNRSAGPTSTAGRAIDEAARKTRGLNTLTAQTRGIINQSSNATDRYSRAMRELDRALESTQISAIEHARAMGQIQLAQRRAAEAGEVLQAQTGRNTFAITNASFQVQDFAVQIASGTDAMRAFAQQAPQFLGALGFTGRLALFGSLAGTVVAVGAAMYMALKDTETATKESGEALDKANEGLDRYRTLLDKARESSTRMGGAVGEMNSSLSRLNRTLADLNRDRFLRGFSEETGNQIRSLTTDVRSFGEAVTDALRGRGQMADLSLQRYFENLQETFQVGPAQAGEIAQVLEPLRDQAQSLTEVAEEAERVNEVFTRMYGTMKNAPAEVQGLWEVIVEGGERAREVLRDEEEARLNRFTRDQEYYDMLLNRVNEQIQQENEWKEAARNRFLQYEDHYNTQLKQINDARTATIEFIREQESQVAMQQAIARYGEESAEVERLKYQEAMNTVEAYIQQNDISGESADNVRRAAEEAYNATAATNNWANAMAAVRAQVAAIAGILSSMGARGIEMVQVQTTREALAKGLSVAEAQTAGQRAAEDVRLKQAHAEARQQASARGGIAGWLGGMAADVAAAAETAQVSALRDAQDALTQEIASAREAERAAAKASKGGGKGGKAKKSEAEKEAERRHKELQRDAERWTERIRTDTENLAAEQAELNMLYEEGYFGEQGSIEALYTFNRAQRMVLEEYDPLTRATIEWTDTLKQGIIDSIMGADSLADAMYRVAESIVEAMWQATLFGEGPLAGLFEQSTGGGILSGLVGWLGGKTSANAKGGVYSSASLSAYSGQMVNQPTMFAFANGAGIMGEAGPEAILPLQRGPDGRLGVTTEKSDRQTRDQKLDVSVSVDGEGNLKAIVRDEAGRVVAESAPGIVRESVKATDRAMKKTKSYGGR